VVGKGGSDSFGTTLSGMPVTRTFTVKNTGTSNLTLSDPINLPGGFSLVSDFGSTTLAPGATTTFSVKLTAAAAGSYGGALSFGTNDSAANPYAFTVSGTVSDTAIADDGDATGFSTTGSRTLWTGVGFHNQGHQGTPGTGSDKATWTFAVAPGTYKVAATWAPHPNRADNAPYTVLDGSTSLGTVRVNQQMAPADFTDAGASWKSL